METPCGTGGAGMYDPKSSNASYLDREEVHRARVLERGESKHELPSLAQDNSLSSDRELAQWTGILREKSYFKP